MAQKKTEGGATPAANANPAGAGGKKITKKEAVRRALMTMGPDAAPKDIQGHIKKRFHIDMTTEHISTTKGELRKAAAVSSPAGKPAAPAPAAGNPKSKAVEMQDILTLKSLVKRVGAEHLKTLIDVMSR
jgi:hypothetical protein